MTTSEDTKALADNEMCAVEGDCEGCGAPDGVERPAACPIQIEARS